MDSWRYRHKSTFKSQATVQKALPENTHPLIVRKTRVHQRQLGCVFPSTFAGLLELSSHLSPTLYSCASRQAHLKDGGISEFTAHWHCMRQNRIRSRRLEPWKAITPAMPEDLENLPAIWFPRQPKQPLIMITVIIRAEVKGYWANSSCSSNQYSIQLYVSQAHRHPF